VLEATSFLAACCELKPLMSECGATSALRAPFSPIAAAAYHSIRVTGAGRSSIVDCIGLVSTALWRTFFSVTRVKIAPPWHGL